jgi:hypothetical protein
MPLDRLWLTLTTRNAGWFELHSAAGSAVFDMWAPVVSCQKFGPRAETDVDVTGARAPLGTGPLPFPYSARRAKAVRVRAAQVAGPSAPATAMARPAAPSRTISHGA